MFKILNVLKVYTTHIEYIIYVNKILEVSIFRKCIIPNAGDSTISYVICISPLPHTNSLCNFLILFDFGAFRSRRTTTTTTTDRQTDRRTVDGRRRPLLHFFLFL